MGSLCGSSTQTVQSELKLPGFIEEGAKRNLALTDKVASRPYEPYPGERIADFTPDTQAGFQAARENVGSFAPFFNAGGMIAGSVRARSPVF